LGRALDTEMIIVTATLSQSSVQLYTLIYWCQKRKL